MSDGHCVGCDTLLLEIDKDPNGDENATCKRCLAEEDHDFDLDPGARFSRSGERTDPQPEWKPATAKAVTKPARIMVDVELLKAWAKTCSQANQSSGASGTEEISRTINAMLAASAERKAKRKKK